MCQDGKIWCGGREVDKVKSVSEESGKSGGEQVESTKEGEEEVGEGRWSVMRDPRALCRNGELREAVGLDCCETGRALVTTQRGDRPQRKRTNALL